VCRHVETLRNTICLPVQIKTLQLDRVQEISSSRAGVLLSRVPGPLLFLVLPAALFMIAERRTIVESTYFTITTLSTIGFGDLAARNEFSCCSHYDYESPFYGRRKYIGLRTPGTALKKWRPWRTKLKAPPPNTPHRPVLQRSFYVK
jgi:hypothetical protein